MSYKHSQLAKLIYEEEEYSGKRFDIVQSWEELWATAKDLRKLFKKECNTGLTVNEKNKVDNLKLKIKDKIGELHIECVKGHEFNLDPRGAPFKMWFFDSDTNGYADVCVG